MKQWGVCMLENLRFGAFQDQKVQFLSQNLFMSPPPLPPKLHSGCVCGGGGSNNQYWYWLLEKLFWDSFNLQILDLSNLLYIKSVQNICYWEKILIDFNLIVREINYDVMRFQRVKSKNARKFGLFKNNNEGLKKNVFGRLTMLKVSIIHTTAELTVVILTLDRVWL